MKTNMVRNGNPRIYEIVDMNLTNSKYESKERKNPT